MSGGDSQYLAERVPRSGADDAALWRRFRGAPGEDAKINVVQRLKQTGPVPHGFTLHLSNIIPPDTLRGEALMRGVWRIGMSRMTLEPSQSPWSVPMPSKHVADRLHRFAWLPDLFSQGEDGAARARACRFLDRNSWPFQRICVADRSDCGTPLALAALRRGPV